MLANQLRKEFKFVLQPDKLEKFKASVAENLQEDVHAVGGYPVMSEYFDSDDLQNYWQKKFGSPNRRKLRSRLYGREDASIPPTAFIEVKHKLDSITVKRRLPCKVHELSMLKDGKIESSTELDANVAREVNDLVKTHGKPTVQIRYDRFAYDSGPDGTLRITFDQNVRCRFGEHQLIPGDDNFENPLLEEGYGIMEVKTIGAVPFWFRQLIGELRVAPRSFSKYITALERYQQLS